MAMQPPGVKGKKPGIMIAVGVKPPGVGGQPKEGLSHVEDHDKDPESTGKATREKALFIPADHHCKDCGNYDGTSGECSKVEGVFDPEDACLRMFSHADEADEEPDADDQGGPPDQDEDDQSYAQ